MCRPLFKKKKQNRLLVWKIQTFQCEQNSRLVEQCPLDRWEQNHIWKCHRPSGEHCDGVMVSVTGVPQGSILGPLLVWCCGNHDCLCIPEVAKDKCEFICLKISCNLVTWEEVMYLSTTKSHWHYLVLRVKAATDFCACPYLCSASILLNVC